MYRMYFPIPNIPIATCNNPAKKKTERIVGSAFSTFPSKFEMISAIKTILTAVIGAVGPEI